MDREQFKSLSYFSDKELPVNYPHLRSLRSLRSGGLSLSGSENDFFKSPTSLECHKAN